MSETTVSEEIENPVLFDAQKRYSSRKFFLAAFFALASTGLTIVDKLTGDQWVEALLWILGLYYTGNIAGYYVGSDNGKLKLLNSKDKEKNS